MRLLTNKAFQIFRYYIYYSILFIMFFLFFVRYYSITNTSTFYFFIAFFFLGLFFLFVGYWYYGIFINPLSIFSLYVFTFSYVFLNFSTKYPYIGKITFFIVLLHVLSFFLFYIFVPRFSYKQIRLKKVSLYKIYHILFYLGCAIFCIETGLNGQLPLYSLIKGQNAYSKQIAIPLLHYFYMFLVTIPGFGYILVKTNKITNSKHYFFSFASCLMLISGQSRQILLLMFLFFLFSYLLIYNKKNTFRKFKLFSNVSIFLFILFFSLFFVVFGNLRTTGGLEDNIKVFLLKFGKIDNVKDLTLFEIWFYIYGPKNFYTLDSFVEKISGNIDSFTFGIYALKPIFSLFFFDRLGIVNYNPEFDGFSKLATYIWEPYFDFGLFGIIFFSLFLSIVLKNSFFEYIYMKKIKGMIKFSILVYCMLMSIFTNFFFTVYIFLLWGMSCFVDEI